MIFRDAPSALGGLIFEPRIWLLLLLLLLLILFGMGCSMAESRWWSSLLDVSKQSGPCFHCRVPRHWLLVSSGALEFACIGDVISLAGKAILSNGSRYACNWESYADRKNRIPYALRRSELTYACDSSVALEP